MTTTHPPHKPSERFLSFPTGLVLTVLLGLGLPLAGSLISNVAYADWRWSDPAFHTFIEFLGAVLAMGLGVMLLKQHETRTQSLYFWVACGLVCMGVLDAFHAFVPPGKTFVWFHSTAVFLGGMLFLVGVLFQNGFHSRRWLSISCGVGFGSIVFGFCFMEMPILIPAMVQDGQFTVLARGLNVLGGLGCILAAWKFMTVFRIFGRVDEWLFSIHCLLFGAAGILFEVSTLWDAGWWWWHLLRLVAYGTGFQCVMTLSQRRRESAPLGPPSVGASEAATIRLPQRKNLTAWLPTLIVAMIFVVIGVGAKTIFLIHQHLVEREGERLGTIAKGVTDRLHQHLSNRRGDVKLLAMAPVLLESNVDAMNAYLSQVSETYEAFVGLSFLNKEGVIIASSNPRLLGQDFSGDLSLLDVQDTLTFDLQDVRPNPALDNALTLTLVNPVFGQENQLVGSVVGHVGVSHMRKIFESAIGVFMVEQGADLEWQLLSQEGMILLENVLSHEGEANLRDIFVPSAWMIISDRTGYIEETHIRRHTPVLTGYAKMSPIPEVPGFYWGVLVRRDKASVLADIQNMETKIGLAGMAMTFPLVALLLVIVRRLEHSQETTMQALSVAQSNEVQLGQMVQENNRLASRNSLILDSAAEGIYGLDLDGVTTFVNPAAAQMLGYAQEELVGLPMHPTVHHSNTDGTPYPRENCPMYAAIKEGTVHRVDTEVLWRKDGTQFPVEYRSTPIRDETGAVTGAVVTFQDITDRKHAERELLNAVMGTQGIVDTAADGIITIDQYGMVESFNKSSRRLFQYEECEVLGKKMSLLIPAPHQEEHDEYLAWYCQTNQQNIIGSSREVIGRRKDGTVFPIDLSVSEVQMGTRTIFTGIVRDITERRESEIALVEARDQAFEAARLKSEFLAMMSHEIRTPMNGVLGMTGILLESDLSNDQRECAKTVKHSADALLTIINDILDFSKIESGKLDIEIIDFDLRVAVEEVLDLAGAKAQEKGLELVGLVYASVPTAVRGDPGRFRQILLNLVGNAIKFTEQGEVTIQIIPETEMDEAVMVRVDVTDTGIGLTPEAQARLFQPFSQVDASTTRKYGGTGLGLSISKQLAELMHGSIGVDSSPGHGSRFWFTLRLEKQAQPFGPKEPPAKSLEGIHACIVDDNDTNRLLMHHYTNVWGMTCLSAENGVAALALMKDAVAQGTPCDLLLLDRQMPEMDGLELARLVKADPKLSGIKMVMLTSMGRRGDASAARDSGICAYLTKPIHQSQLRECLGLVMNGDPNTESQFVTKYTLQEAKTQVDARLLVADDNVVNQKVAVRMFERLGYRVDVVANGLEAVEAVSRIAYDAVFMDCQMPEMDGYEATQTIRAKETAGEHFGRDSQSIQVDANAITRIPIIAMTANAMQGDREHCLDIGMDDFVSKPVNVEALEAVLDRWIPKKETSLGAGEETVAGCLSLVASEEKPIPGSHVVASDQQPATSDDSQDTPLDAATLDGLKELGGDDPSFLIEVIQQFLHDGPRHVAAIRHAVVQTDADALMKAAHSLKGGCRNMGALSLGELCFALEEKGRAGETGNMEELLSAVDQEYSCVQSALEVELGRLIPSPT